MIGIAHEVYVPCNCGEEAEHCTMERYISDVRIAWAEIQQLRRRLEAASDQVEASA